MKLFHTKLHLDENQLYLRETEFSTFEPSKKFSKRDIDVSFLFKNNNSIDRTLVVGKQKLVDKDIKVDIYDRFLKVRADAESKYADHGIQLWDLGIANSESSEEEDYNIYDDFDDYEDPDALDEYRL